MYNKDNQRQDQVKFWMHLEKRKILVKSQIYVVQTHIQGIIWFNDEYKNAIPCNLAKYLTPMSDLYDWWSTTLQPFR